jgi:hypothetical protein
MCTPPKTLGGVHAFGWLSWCRRLSRDHQGLPETSPDVDLYCDDPDHGSSSSMISYLSSTFQTPSKGKSNSLFLHLFVD